MMLGRLTRRLGTLACIAAASLVVTANPVHAQRAGMNMGGMGETQIAVSSRQLAKFGEILGLSEAQREAASALHDGYQEQHRAEAKAMQDTMKAAQQEFMDSQDPSVFTDELPDKIRKHTEKMKGLEESFLRDVQALLKPEQAALWPRVERYHRRSKSLPSGMLAGESLNLITIVDDLEAGEPSNELRVELEAYEVELDRALVERDAQREKLQKESEESMKNFDFSKMDFTAIRKMMTDLRKSGIRVRDVNERHARIVSNLLPEAKQEQFRDRVRSETFPQVYKSAHPETAMETALEFDDLSTEQRESITRTLETYKRDLAAANQRWADAIAEEEKDGGGDPFMGFGGFMGGDRTETPTQTARKARRELDKSALAKLKEVLTDDQASRLPEREPEFPWMNMGGGGGGDDGDAPNERANERRERRRN